MGAAKAIKRDPFSAIAAGIVGGPTGVLISARQSAQAAKKENTLRGQIKTIQKSSQEEIARQKAIADESVRAQKAKARQRTIFAGSGSNNVFSPTLGGASYNSTLG